MRSLTLPMSWRKLPRYDYLVVIAPCPEFVEPGLDRQAQVTETNRTSRPETSAATNPR